MNFFPSYPRLHVRVTVCISPENVSHIDGSNNEHRNMFHKRLGKGVAVKTSSTNGNTRPTRLSGRD